MSGRYGGLTAADDELISAARSAIEGSTDAEPGGHGIHTMGAAVRAVDGRIVVGVNVYHFTGEPCAELVALGAARAAGITEVATIVAVGDHGRGVIGPCGRDRQVLFDYYPGIRVVVPTPDGLRAMSPAELLPAATAWSFEDGSVPSGVPAGPRDEAAGG